MLRVGGQLSEVETSQVTILQHVSISWVNETRQNDQHVPCAV